jgi:hypothetical protein
MRLNLSKSLKALLGIAFVTLLIVSGCKKDNDTTSAPTPAPVDTCGTPSMSFLANGRVLKYNYTVFGNTDTLAITIKSYGANDEFQFLLVYGGTPVDTTYGKECGGWLYRSDSYPLLSTYKDRKSTTAVNDTWNYSDASVTATYKVIAKNVSVTVTAGTFVCDKITYHDVSTINTDTLYFNNTVGDVKYNGALFDYELKSKNF